MLLGIIVFLIVSITNDQQQDFGQYLSQQISRISTFFKAQDSGLMREVAQLTTDHHQAHGAKWAKNTTTIYIDTTNATIKSAYEEAINRWNQTNSFTFVRVTSKTAAKIIATDYSDANTQAAGLAETQTNALTKRIVHVDVKLNTYYLLNPQYGYSMERIIHTAEHELGHAIGLNHDSQAPSVMQPTGSYDGIQASDVQKVIDLYQN